MTETFANENQRGGPLLVNEHDNRYKFEYNTNDNDDDDESVDLQGKRYVTELNFVLKTESFVKKKRTHHIR